MVLEVHSRITEVVDLSTRISPEQAVSKILFYITGTEYLDKYWGPVHGLGKTLMDLRKTLASRFEELKVVVTLLAQRQVLVILNHQPSFNSPSSSWVCAEARKKLRYAVCRSVDLTLRCTVRGKIEKNSTLRCATRQRAVVRCGLWSTSTLVKRSINFGTTNPYINCTKCTVRKNLYVSWSITWRIVNAIFLLDSQPRMSSPLKKGFLKVRAWG